VIRFSFNTWNHSVTWGSPPCLPEQIGAAAAAGYDFIGLDLPSLIAHRDGGLHPTAIADALDQHGISCYELVPLSITDDRAVTEASVEEVRQLGPAVGARTVLAVARGPVTDALVDNTRLCGDALSELGISVAIEFLPSVEVNSIDRVLHLIDLAGVTGLRVMVDSWHFFAGPSTWGSLDDLPVEQLGFVQFSDAAPPVTDDVVHEYRQRRVMPGEGVHDLRRFADVIARKAPDVTVSVEVLSEAWRQRPPAAMIRASLAATRPFWRSEGQGDAPVLADRRDATD
jgi:sugar phosphate isomerase/epimerase